MTVRWRGRHVFDTIFASQYEGLVGQIQGKHIWVDPVNGNDGYSGRNVDVPKATIQAAENLAVAGDWIDLVPGEYDENVVVDTADITIFGHGARGRPWINPTAGGGMLITADDVVLINVGIAGEAGAAYALKLLAANECRFYGSKFEGPTGTVVLLDGDDDGQCGNILFDDCEWIWGGSGLLFDASGYGYPTNVRVRRSMFGNLTVVHIGDGPNAGGVTDLVLEDNVHYAGEDGTPPTDFLKLDRVGNTGLVSGCRFAYATNEADVLEIAAGIMWTANATEAGWSTARPS